MQALTPAERRGALVVVLLLGLGALRDLWVARHPVVRSLAPGATSRAAEPDPAPPAAPSPPAPRDEARPPVDLNQAGLAELDALPGIGPVLAQRILTHRREHGPFRSVEELLAVRGIGPRLLEKLRPRVRVGPP